MKVYVFDVGGLEEFEEIVRTAIVQLTSPGRTLDDFETRKLNALNGMLSGIWTELSHGRGVGAA